MVAKVLFAGTVTGEKAVIQALRRTIVDDISIFSPSAKTIVDIAVDGLFLFKGIVINTQDVYKIRDEGIILEPGSVLTINSFSEVKVKVDGRVIPDRIENPCNPGQSFDLSDFATKEELAAYAKIQDLIEDSEFSTWSGKKIQSKIDNSVKIVGTHTVDDTKDKVAYSAEYVDATFIPKTTLTDFMPKEKFEAEAGVEKLVGKWFGKDEYIKGFEATTGEANNTPAEIISLPDADTILSVTGIIKGDEITDISRYTKIKGKKVELTLTAGDAALAGKPSQVVVRYTK